jgi:hypothetical protein
MAKKPPKARYSIALPRTETDHLKSMLSVMGVSFSSFIGRFIEGVLFKFSKEYGGVTKDLKDWTIRDVDEFIERACHEKPWIVAEDDFGGKENSVE